MSQHFLSMRACALAPLAHRTLRPSISKDAKMSISPQREQHFSKASPPIATPKWPQTGRKFAPRWPKMPPRWPKMPPRWPKMPEDSPRWPQDGPKMTQDTSG